MVGAGPRVAITGIGVVSAAGSTRDTFWASLLAGRGVARPVEHLDVSDAPIRFGCEVTDFDPLSVLSNKEAKRADRVTQFTLGAGDAALADAALGDVDPTRVGIVMGTGFGGLETAEEGAREFLGVKNPALKGRINPLFIPMVMPNAGAASFSQRHGFRGPCMSISTACAAGANAIGEGMRLLREGSADIVIAGGAEAPLTPWVITAFAAAHALSERADDPTVASRPFDRDRDGIVMGEGAAVVVLERLDDARARGATVHAEILGYGRNADAHHPTSPPPDGRGAADCMRLALADAGLEPSDVAHISAHGTSTAFNDAAEAIAIRTVFGAGAPPVTSVKGVLGHAIGAAGALEAVASVLTLQTGTIPPTANCVNLDPEIEVDVVREPRELGAGVILSNSFAFGGHNAVLVFGRAI
jgi:3-oxoacyl-[acyl-carrier-protein] synthase II